MASYTLSLKDNQVSLAKFIKKTGILQI